MKIEDAKLKDLMNKARDFHNGQDFHTRTMFCISALQTQITTLLQQQEKIKQNAKKQCSEIDDHIKNIARGLEENFKALDIIKIRQPRVIPIFDKSILKRYSVTNDSQLSTL